MHAGSRDLLLYQHRARCTLGASCLPFISTGYTDVGVGLCASWWICARVCVCACLPDTEADRIFFWVLDWARADCVSVPASMWICEYVCICVLAKCGCVWEREQRDHIPSLSQGTQGAYNFKGPWGPATPACPPRGKSCWCGGACLGKTSS